jgi:hypothetical protein
MTMLNLSMTQDEKTITVSVTEALAESLETVANVRGGTFAFVSRLVSGTPGKDKCVTPSITDRWFLAMPRYDRYLARLSAAVAHITLADVREALADNAVSARPDFAALFATAIANVGEGYAGTRSDTVGQRAGAVSCYAHFGKARVHLVTEKGTDGIMRPVANGEGNMVGDSAMVPFYEIRRRTYQKAVYLPTNSRPLTIVQDAIRDLAHKETGLAEWKALSVQKANYGFITLDSARIHGLVRDLMTAELDARFAEAYREIGNLAAGPFQTLQAEAQAVTEPASVVSR